jgi:hypothetical protein
LFNYNLLLNSDRKASSHLSLHLHFHLQRQLQQSKQNKIVPAVFTQQANWHMIGVPALASAAVFMATGYGQRC